MSKSCFAFTFAVALLVNHAVEAEHTVNAPGIGFFGNENGSFTDVMEREFGASIHMHIDKTRGGSVGYAAVWDAISWTRIDVIENRSVDNPRIRANFQPYPFSDLFRIPETGASMMLPPSESGFHALSFDTQAGDVFCFDETTGESICFGDYFLTYDIVEVPTPIPGDANFDDAVTFSDFLILSKNFGLGEGAFPTYDDGDFDLDGAVLMQDFMLLSRHFGETRAVVSQVSIVPEPSSWPTCVLAFVGVCVARRRRISHKVP